MAMDVAGGVGGLSKTFAAAAILVTPVVGLIALPVIGLFLGLDAFSKGAGGPSPTAGG